MLPKGTIDVLTLEQHFKEIFGLELEFSYLIWNKSHLIIN